MPDFQLVTPYKAAGDQVKAIQKISDSFLKGKKKVTLVGVTGSGKTFTMAEVIQKVKRPTLVLSHNKTLAAQLYREFKEFFPNNSVEYFVSYYDYYQPEAYVPSSDTFIEKDSSINEDIDKLRLRATSSVLEREDVIIVSSVSCIYGLGSPEDYTESRIILKRGQTLERDLLIKKLLHIQYQRNDLDFSRGNFRVRGDSLELMPAYHEDGLRIEFFGDEIESLSRFNPLTGKVISKMETMVIYPAKHFITSGPKVEDAIRNIKEEVAIQIKSFKEKGKLLEAERIESRTNYDLEMLAELGYCNGIENYSRHLTGRNEGERPACLIDYFPKDFLLIVDESHVTIPQIGGMYAGDRARKETLVEFGFRLPSALDNRPLNFQEFETMTDKILYVSATPADYEIKNSEIQVEQIIRPTGLLDPVVEVRPVANQVEDLLIEINARVEKKERILITTLTKKMSEDLTDYLKEVGVKVAYLHSEVETIQRVEIIRDLRKGIYDCIVGINLLREGLDIPEVSLVAILDADKEGFLRNYKSLIQTIGRAARNINGMAILYADKLTDSMKKAIEETNRRRKIQSEHNQKFGIEPKTIIREIHDILPREVAELSAEEETINEIEREFTLKKYKTPEKLREKLKEAMLAAAKELNFEKATMLRDKMLSIQDKNK
ncbi:MAG TPA: excinuclease ABC subunit UvrB [Leptospiraceae bacterium]|nr:excinuclease ABC subunit UvrB [Leptospiraceae bacterium]HMW06322.1 excinuclease ABC subunit UvrB [Leptospiraceae bacterium]HMX30999.1 excinuclease ABC subunit UvrB [Leptospiraceae bacterium]HMY32182.1 excinuclease ABC subunit UvrB [Leptospiraceae bacterium]HMZ63817.1 excinuclease ABC subunit UvrB [Leptospiraceae bacterium]